MLLDAEHALSPEIESLFAAVDRLRSIAQSMRGAMGPYMQKDTFLARPGSGDSPIGRGNPTSAAFAATILTDASAFDELARTVSSSATRESLLAYLAELSSKSVREQFARKKARERATAAIDTDAELKAATPAPALDAYGSETFSILPNPYNSPIILAGLATLLSDKYAKPTAVLFHWLIGMEHAARYIAEAALHNGGYLPSLARGDYVDNTSRDGAVSVPSYVFTYWASLALDKYCSVVRDYKIPFANRTLMADAVAAMSRWAQSALATQIAAHHAGARALFDPAECLCCVATVFLTQRGLGKSPAIQQVAEHALELVLDHYIERGLLTTSRPFVLADKSNRQVTSSSYESLCYLITAMRRKDIWPRNPSKLLSVVRDTAEHIKANWEAHGGAANDQDVRFGVIAKPTAYSTSAAKALVSHGVALAERFADIEAQRLLGVGPPIALSGDIFSVDPTLDSILTSSVIGVVNSKDDSIRKRGCFSMIWFGPPGTGKTTAARALAGQLGWPLLEITQKDFLVRGADFIDACAERIFKLLLRVRNVVVLFDELEELVQSRESEEGGKKPLGPNATADRHSRLLTTSMLPRIHELRDQMNVVFIFATNRLRSFDTAATRLGRFDAIIGLPPPGPEARAAIFEKALEIYFADVDAATVKEVRDLLEAQKFPRQKPGVIAKDIHFVVSQIRNDFARTKKIDPSAVAKLASGQTVSIAMLESFRSLVSEASRPSAKYEMF